MRTRVAVTGIGLRTPAGNHVKTVLDTLNAGVSVAAPVPELAGAPVGFACTVPDFDATEYCSVRELRQLERPVLLALVAALDAVEESGCDIAAEPESAGVLVGTGIGGLTAAEHLVARHHTDPGRVSPTTVPRIMASSAAARISLRTGAQGSCLTYTTACASGATAIGEAASKIRSGELDVVIAGGVDSGISPVVMSSFARMSALSTRDDEPRLASRPFDRDRDGFVMGEGAAFVVLERWDRAVARGARILGEISGYATNSDAHHIVAPREDGAVAARCMRRAIADAGLTPSDISHVNAHGTSTALNDQAEALAIAATFGAHRPPVTAPKGVFGHLIGAAGAVEAVVSLATANTGLVPPVANFAGSDLTDLIDVVAGTPREVPRGHVLSNSFAFGGHNACLVLGPGDA
ncbi:beta-ketoacyl-[acyl-carrier-protein] synthase family protein [Lentzea sp. NPDC051838]|uniref:beta-ketoacyl-[acyl-carrier-protein] synthase family protein n=1 Tax=Lentzea sp. NPDC051838 TaxID=3154849 RepID=UPI00343CC336